ncbi:MAG: PAS domain-containing protein [Comamonadaceae bacterium]|uniref:PAS domain-containing protein n=1 Tax=Candidatus Skiveiella danica TaxID=3386177 RepID=UPI003909FC53|nr:PAS domain-containing protein [Comamonadaceae bacterium]
MSGEPYAPTLGAAIAALRQKAEAVLDNGVRPDPQGVDDRSPDALRQALHELQVHQIELELQNDELRRMQVELDAERARYFDLYDLAPVGYCTISEHGLILEANFTAANLLGLARSELVGEPLSRFIVRADQDIYYLCRRHLVDTGEPQACELRMMPVGGAPFWAHLSAAAAPDARGSRSTAWCWRTFPSARSWSWRCTKRTSSWRRPARWPIGPTGPSRTSWPA